jgi:hypothetical protein
VVIGLIGIGGCLYLFVSLPIRTQLFFVTAQVIGLVLYAIYAAAAERACSDDREGLMADPRAGRGQPISSRCSSPSCCSRPRRQLADDLQ